MSARTRRSASLALGYIVAALWTAGALLIIAVVLLAMHVMTNLFWGGAP